MIRRPKILSVLLGLAIFLGLFAPVAPLTMPAAAQYQERGSGGLWGVWQRSRRERTERRDRRQRAIEHLRERREVAPRRARGEQRRSAPKRRSSAAAAATPSIIEPEAVPVAKAPDARPVLVIGDFLAGGLAEGLDTVFQDDARTRIVDRTNGSSGLVRDDHYDWPASIAEILETEKPVAVLLMLGSNDRQDMRIGSDRYAARSKEWLAEYSARATVLAAAVEEHGIPLLWVGMPSFKQTKLSSEMLALNDIFRTVSSSVDAEFIDVWDGFVDENGAFVTTGPDINGQPVRLRSSDGINMTAAGKRKLAFYTERPLAAYLSGAGQPIASLGSPNASPQFGPAMPPAEIVRTLPIALTDPQLDGGSELLGADPAGAAALKPAPTSSKPRQGRADAFGPMQPPAQASRTPAPESTSSVQR